VFETPNVYTPLRSQASSRAWLVRSHLSNSNPRHPDTTSQSMKLRHCQPVYQQRRSERLIAAWPNGLFFLPADQLPDPRHRDKPLAMNTGSSEPEPASSQDVAIDTKLKFSAERRFRQKSEEFQLSQRSDRRLLTHVRRSLLHGNCLRVVRRI